MAMSAAAAGLLGSGIQTAGSVLNSAIGLVAANHGAFKQYKYNSLLQKEAAKLNYKYGKKNALNSPTWNRQGLESAGYNPMLAVQNGTAGTNSSWTSNSSVSAPDYAGLGVGDLISNATRLQEIKNQTAQTASQVDVNDATAENQRAEASNKRAENPYISQREEAGIKRTEADTTKIQNESDNIKAQTELLDDYYELEKKKTEYIKRGQDMSLEGVKYSADRSLQGSIYSSDRSYDAAVKSAKIHNAGTVYNANTMKDIADEHSPSSRSQSFKHYASGTSDIISSILHGSNNYYEGEEHTYDYDRNGHLSHERHKGTKGKKGKRK